MMKFPKVSALVAALAGVANANQEPSQDSLRYSLDRYQKGIGELSELARECGEQEEGKFGYSFVLKNSDGIILFRYYPNAQGIGFSGNDDYFDIFTGFFLDGKPAYNSLGSAYFRAAQEHLREGKRIISLEKTIEKDRARLKSIKSQARVYCPRKVCV